MSPCPGPVTNGDGINAENTFSQLNGQLAGSNDFQSQFVQSPMPCFSLLVHYQFLLLSQSITNLTPQSSLSLSLLLLFFFIQLQWLRSRPEWKVDAAQGKIKLLFQYALYLQAVPICLASELKNGLTMPWSFHLTIFIEQMQHFGLFSKAPGLIFLVQQRNRLREHIGNTVSQSCTKQPPPYTPVLWGGQSKVTLKGKNVQIKMEACFYRHIFLL